MAGVTTVLTNDLQDKQLGKVITTTINGGLSSPFPTDSVAPVPSAKVTVADPDAADYIYMVNDAASVTFPEPETSLYVRKALTGDIASVQQGTASNLVQVDVDHLSSRLNQDIVTRPLMSSGRDNGIGSWLIQGAFTQFASECGLFVDGIKGNVLLGITNRTPGIGYYRHESRRFLGIDFAEDANLIQWVPTESSAVDNGISLDVGESLNLVVGLTSLAFMSGTPTFGASIGFAQGSEDSFGVGWDWGYFTNTGVLLVLERRAGSPDKTVFNINVGNYTTRPMFTEIKVTRTAATTLKYDLRVVYDDDVRPTFTATATVTNSYMTTSLTPMAIELSSTRLDMTSPNQDTYGVRSLYITKDAPDNDRLSWVEQGVEITIGVPNNPSWDYSVVAGVAGNAWQLVHDLASAYGLVFDPLTFRFATPSESTLGAVYTTPTSGLAITGQARDMSETVEVVNYDYKHSQDVYDNIQLYKSDTAYSLAVGERQEHIVQTDATFSFLYQPYCVTPTAARNAQLNQDYGESLYSVYDSGFRAVTPREWDDGGGFISVEGTGVPGEMKLVIQAPTNKLTTADPPFIISIESSIPSLIIAGIGAIARKKTITSYTGAGQGINIKKLGTTYDNPMVATDRMAWEVAALLGSLHGTTPTTINLNIPDESQTNLYAPKVLHKGSMYLPTAWSKQGNVLNVSSALRYTSCKEMNEFYGNMTNAQYNTLFAGKTISYANITPLKDEE